MARGPSQRIPRVLRPQRHVATVSSVSNNGDARVDRATAAITDVTRDFQEMIAITEVLLQSAIYCGVPHANTAFRTAQQVFAVLDQTTDHGPLDRPDRSDTGL